MLRYLKVFGEYSIIFWFFETSNFNTFSIFLIFVLFSLNLAFVKLFKSTNLSNHSSFFLKNCLIGMASKNSFAIYKVGRELILFKSFIHLIFLLFRFFFCKLIKNILFSWIIKLHELKQSGKFLRVSAITFIIFPLPAPSSNKLKCFGEPILFQNVITQIAIISEKSLVILGAVIKSPSFPKGFFFI